MCCAESGSEASGSSRSPAPSPTSTRSRTALLRSMLRSSAAGLPLSSVHPVSGTKADSRQLPVRGLTSCIKPSA